MDRLKSRKFWLTVVAVLTTVSSYVAGDVVAADAIWAVVAVVGAYLGVEGFGDAAERYSRGKRG